MNNNVEVNEVQTDDGQQDAEFGGLYYRVIRLVTGEELVCGFEADDLNHTAKKYVTLHSPLLAVNGTLMKWSTITDQTEFEILSDSILTSYHVSDKVLDEYDAYLDALYINHVKNLLAGDQLSEDEREDFERQLEGLYDGSYVPEDLVISEAHLTAIPTSKYLH